MRKRRIYYVPGIISLIFLPILCYSYLKPYNKTEGVLQIALPLKYKPHPANGYTLRFDTAILSTPGNKRIYQDFRLSGNDALDSRELEKFEKRRQELIAKKDTINGLHILFSDSVTYGYFIKTLNFCFTDPYPFIFYDNHLWYLYKNIDPEAYRRFFKRHQEERKEDWRQYKMRKEIEKNSMPLKEKYYGLPKLWPSAIITILLVILSVRFIKGTE